MPSALGRVAYLPSVFHAETLVHPVKLVTQTARLLKPVEEGDKVLKLAQATFGLVAAVEGPLSEGWSGVYGAIKTTRIATGILKAPGAINRVMVTVRNTGALLASISAGDIKPVTLAKDDPYLPSKPGKLLAYQTNLQNYDLVVTNQPDKTLALASCTLGLVADTTLLVGANGAGAVINATEAWGGVNLSKNAHHLGSQIGLLLFINHIATFINNIVKWILDARLFNNKLSLHTAKEGQKELYKVNTKKQVNYFLKQAKVTAELVGDVALFTPVSVLYKAITTMVSASLDFIGLWISTP